MTPVVRQDEGASVATPTKASLTAVLTPREEVTPTISCIGVHVALALLRIPP